MFFLVSLCAIMILLRKSPAKFSLTVNEKQEDQQPNREDKRMTSYRIIEHTSKAPKKRAFKVIIPRIISEVELKNLVEDISRKYRIGNEIIFINWWLADQNIATDICWATTRSDNGSFDIGFNTNSLEERLEVVEIRPLVAPDELGLWYWDRGELSHFIHIINSKNDRIKIHKIFLDGSNAWEEKIRLPGAKLRFLWTRESDPDKEYFEYDGVAAVIEDRIGIAVKLEKLR